MALGVLFISRESQESRENNMATKEFRFTIGENEYFIMQWPARKAIKMKLRIAKILGSSVTELANGIGKSEGQQIEAFGKAIQSAFESSSEDDILDLLVEVVENATVNGNRLQGKFDEFFTDNISEAYKVFFQIIMKNFGDFIVGLQSTGKSQ